MAKENQLKEFIAEFTPLRKKYPFIGILMVAGLPAKEDGLTEEGVLLNGDEDYIARVISTASQIDPQLRRVIDKVAVAIAINDNPSDSKSLKRND